ncbi:MAG: RDD family protein [Chitinophagaceae bacterium]
MAVIRVPTTFNIDLEFEIPEFYRRLFALAIDMLVQFIYIRIATEFFRSIVNNMVGNEDSYYNISAVAVLLSLPVFIYHVVMEITMNGQSIGKKIMGIRVVNENGGRPSPGQFIIRWLLRVSDVWIVILLIYFLQGGGGSPETIFLVTAVVAFLLTDIILVVASKKSQRIGDMLAKTIIIRTSQQADIEETVFQEVEETYVPVYPQIMQLSDRDINAIKNILEAAKRKQDPEMALTATFKILQHLKIQTEQSPVEFLETLLKDYNYLSTK